MACATSPAGARALMVIVALFGGACAKREAPTSTLNSVPPALASASPVATAGASAAASATPEPTPDPITAPPAVSASPTPGEVPAANVSFKTSTEGCLAAANESDMARFPANTRASPSGVQLESDA